MNDFIIITFKAPIHHTSTHIQSPNIRNTTLLNRHSTKIRLVINLFHVLVAFFVRFFDTGDKMSMSQKLIFSPFVLDLFGHSFHYIWMPSFKEKKKPFVWNIMMLFDEHIQKLVITNVNKFEYQQNSNLIAGQNCVSDFLLLIRVLFKLSFHSFETMILSIYNGIHPQHINYIWISELFIKLTAFNLTFSHWKTFSLNKSWSICIPSPPSANESLQNSFISFS